MEEAVRSVKAYMINSRRTKGIRRFRFFYARAARIALNTRADLNGVLVVARRWRRGWRRQWWESYSMTTYRWIQIRKKRSEIRNEPSLRSMTSFSRSAFTTP